MRNSWGAYCKRLVNAWEAQDQQLLQLCTSGLPASCKATRQLLCSQASHVCCDLTPCATSHTAICSHSVCCKQSIVSLPEQKHRQLSCAALAPYAANCCACALAPASSCASMHQHKHPLPPSGTAMPAAAMNHILRSMAVKDVLHSWSPMPHTTAAGRQRA